MKSVVLAFCICAAFLFYAEDAFACSCLPRPSVLESFEESDVVMIGRITAIEDGPKSNPEGYYPRDPGIAHLVVEKVYKGNVAVRDELQFVRGNGADCLITFDKLRIGSQLLLYLRSPKESRWAASFCNRSTGVGAAQEDLLYLNNMKKLRGKTRVSGEYGEWNGDNVDVANKEIRIRGEKKTYRTKTNQNGVYEIYDLPPGKYFLEPEPPKGWRINRMWLSNVGGISWGESLPGTVAFTLGPKRHVSINVSFEPDNAVEGSVVDALGNPMKGVCAYLWTPERTYGYGPSDCTNDKGKFRIESVMPGSYVLVLNPYGASSKENYPRLFYPSVTQREKATLITIGETEVVKGINLVLPKPLETVTVRGVLQYSDKTPAPETSVEFEATPMEGFDGNARAETGAQGRFTLTILKGLKGKIFAKFWFRMRESKDCPELEALEKEEKTTTPPIVIDATKDIDNLVLTYPFPRCEPK